MYDVQRSCILYDGALRADRTEVEGLNDPEQLGRKISDDPLAARGQRVTPCCLADVNHCFWRA
jgi:hypothetical protein